ncbi:hypothetical protein Y1Q_0009364 [Alligator mississippiensis]|uniref:Uncharacterized protein n=1 Tax=Alligator mississippiensis TaxID=8496 RepID=A0A151N7H7_ALLMI|nr:hypothetical protein Y1Q_0009364 [Alligator mississippiensis]
MKMTAKPYSTYHVSQAPNGTLFYPLRISEKLFLSNKDGPNQLSKCSNRAQFRPGKSWLQRALHELAALIQY